MLKDIAAEAHNCYSEEFKSYCGRVFNMKRLKSSGKTALSRVLIFSYLENLFHFQKRTPRKWPDTFSSHFQTTESLSWGNGILLTLVMWIFTSQFSPGISDTEITPLVSAASPPALAHNCTLLSVTSCPYLLTSIRNTSSFTVKCVIALGFLRN